MNTTRKCPHCNQDIPLEAQFCLFCGTRVSPQLVSSSAPPAQPSLPATPPLIKAQPLSPPPRGRSDWPIILLVVGVIGMLCCLTVAAIAWWQRENIAMLSGLITEPTATRTPRATNTPRGTPKSMPTEPTPEIVTEVVVAPTALPSPGQKLCLLPYSDVTDNSFNSLAWSGLQTAATRYNYESIYIKPGGYAQENYEKAIEDLITQDCELIVGVGYMTGDAVQYAAKAHTRQKFMLLEMELDPELNNVWSHTYSDDQGAFLAGYLAAGVSKTGNVATFGGMDIPPVTLFMDGFVAGVSHYNAQHSTTVEALDWDITSQSGLFTKDFADQQKGVNFTKQLIDRGADIIFPIAGAAGYGAAAEAATHADVYIIGVDDDWVISHPEYARVILTSVEKRLDASILRAVAALASNTFEGGTHMGTLPDEIKLAPYHELDTLVSDDLQAELEQVTADILAGKIDTRKVSKPVSGLVKSGELTIWVNYTLPDTLNSG